MKALEPLPDDDKRLAAVTEKYASFAPVDMYISLVKESALKANRHIVTLLTPLTSWSSLTRLDLSKTYVGPKACVPVLDVCRLCDHLTYINFSDNYVENEVVWDLCGMAFFHPSLEEIELSNNSGISWSGAMCLADLVKRNNRIQYVGLRQTNVAFADSEAIFSQTRYNAARQFALRNLPSNPSDHPTAIRLRAMKRFFYDLSHGSGKVDSAVAVREGVRERQRVLGKSRETTLFNDAYYESMLVKAPAKLMTWDTFVVLVLMQCSDYFDDIVNALHRVFLEFQVGSDRSQDLGETLVEVRCYPAIYARLYGSLPSDETLTYLKKRLDLEDAMTVNWDDFLFCFYNGGPSVGGALLGVGITPQPLHCGVNHF